MEKQETDWIFRAITPRQLDVLAAIGVEGRHAALARSVGMSVSTFRSHLRDLHVLTDCHSQSELCSWWRGHRDGYISFVMERVRPGSPLPEPEGLPPGTSE